MTYQKLDLSMTHYDIIGFRLPFSSQLLVQSSISSSTGSRLVVKTTTSLWTLASLLVAHHHYI
jgi:hypothetical protein